MTSSNHVLIDIEKSSNATTLSEKEMVHFDELGQVLKLVEKDYIELKTDDWDIEPHAHNTITILGTRGSGKTSFLLSLKAQLADEKKFKNRYFIPDMIDPTNMEDKAHVFLLVIAAIKSEVDEKVFSQVNKRKEQEGWTVDFRKLAEALPTVDGLGSENFESWQDAEYILESGTRMLASLRMLRKNFRSFVRTSLRILRKDQMVLMFDDSDVDFKKSWPVLETIRKYLSIPEIIVILSGDLKFYRLSVRKQHWMNFGKGLLKNEYDKEANLDSSYKELVTEMESQYLLKVAKPDRRILLKTLYEKTLYSSDRSGLAKKRRILVKKLSKPIELIAAYHNILTKFGIGNGYQAEPYISYLLRQPIRTQIQFLSVLMDNPVDDDNRYLEIFLSSFLVKHINIELINSFPSLLNSELLKLLLNEKGLVDMYQLQPITYDDNLNGCLTGYSLLSSQYYRQRPELIFDYFIKIGLIRNLYGFLPYKKEDENISELNSPSLEGLIYYASLQQDRVLRDSVGHINSYVIGALGRPRRFAGIIPVLAPEGLVKSGRFHAENRIDVVFEGHPDESVIAYMPLARNTHMTKSSSSYSYSIYALLGAIGECIRKVQVNDLRRGVIELSQLRTYPIPDFDKQVFARGREEGFDEGILLDNDGINVSDALLGSVGAWIKSNEAQFVSPHLLGKISTRFFYTLQSIEEHEDLTNLSKMMEIRVVAFLNSVLVEEAREVLEEFRGFSLSNLRSTLYVFERNLAAFQKSKESEKFRLFKWLSTCPLLIAFLNPKGVLGKIGSQRITKGLGYIKNGVNVYSLLSSVAIKENISMASVSNPANIERKVSRRDLSIGELVDMAIKMNLPFDLFKSSTSRGKTMQRNRSLRKAFAEVIDPGQLSSPRLRDIRKYIEKRKIRW